MSGVVITAGAPALHALLERLARSARMVFFAGLPGTGKSLMIQQLAHLAAGNGRRVSVLQWDVARPVFEASPAGGRYPVVDGVTNPLVRKAVGAWARRAIADWGERHRDDTHLLIGETPLIGGRLVEVARHQADAAETVLDAESTRFVIPVPSREVRAFLEAERERRAARPVHGREREDAPPAVLRALWRELMDAARDLGVASRDALGVASRDARAGISAGDDITVDSWAQDAPYDPELYARVYESVLHRRHVDRLPLDVRLPVEGRSVYEFSIPLEELSPSADEASAILRETEAVCRDVARLDEEIRRWYVT